ncbi:MAG: septum site-determining protein MinC [Leptolyngbyaceae cyanobacterium MO_188.B28]|nr:septum site-determining protein MinC [Leptolyngbyaceae cyanobacterium MO_188.B28]
MNSDTSSSTAVTPLPETLSEETPMQQSAANALTPSSPEERASQTDSTKTPGGSTQLDDAPPENAPENAPETSSTQGSPHQTPSPTGSEETPAPIPANPNLQIQLKSEAGRLLLRLPPNPENSRSLVPWSDLWLQLKQRLNGGDRFWQPQTVVHLVAGDYLLDGRQLQTIAEALEEAQLQLKRVYTSRRQTAVAAATSGYSVEQESAVTLFSQASTVNGQALDDPLYLQTTIRSGVEIRHPGTVVILGDVNPGGSVIADGDILIWGHLRGIAHAGASGRSQCRIMALHMQPTQLRIADKVARAPETPPARYQPEVAYIGSDSIRIAIATEFSRVNLNRSFG